MWRRQFPNIMAFFFGLTLLAWLASPTRADQDDPPTRVARLAYVQGSVSFQPAGTDDWVAPGINRPMTTGDKVWADNDGRVELQLDGSMIHLANDSGFSFLNLNDNVTQIQLTSGTILVRVRRVDENETYEIDTPNLAFSVLRPGTYRISVNENGDGTLISARSGEGEVTGGGAAYSIRAGESYSFFGTDQLSANPENYGSDQFEGWAASRDRRWENSSSAHYVSADVIGYGDLDEYGSWRETPEYGHVWVPRTSEPDWAPYRYGRWEYIAPWGYTWVDEEPWGFAPFHYGRWVNFQSSWCWVPAPPHAERAEYVRPVYAPALVAWVGGSAGAAVAWFPLGPREVYVPPYAVSRQYVDRVNVSNTTVNTTVVNNYYNTTIVNNNTTVTNVKYVNQSVPGAVVATSPQAFTAAQPVAKNIVKVDQRTVASAPVRAAAPPVAPTKQAVLGTTAPAAKKPPVAVETRTVVAKAAPPPPPPSFENRQEAIKNNGGKPLSPAQIRKIEPAATTAAAVKIAPPPKSGANAPASHAPGQPSTAPSAKTAPAPPPANRPAPPSNVKPEPNKPAPNPAAPPNRPGEQPATPNSNAKPEPNKPPTPNPAPPNRPAEHPPTNRPPEHPPARPEAPNNPPAPSRSDRPAAAQPRPNEPPAATRPSAPPPKNPELEKKHQQEQEQLRMKQEQERQKLQQEQQQQRQHADQAQKQRLEQQHQQQIQQQQQKHAQEQKQIEQKQQQEKQQKKPQKPEPPPQQKP